MKADRLGGNIQLLLQPPHQRGQALDLALGEGAAITAADEADADGMLVVLSPRGPGDVGAGKLSIPTVADVNDAVAEAVAVTDEEVISEALVAVAEMQAMDGLGVAGGLAEIVDHDASPSLVIKGGSSLKDRIRFHVAAEGLDAGGEISSAELVVAEREEANAEGHGGEE